jgi:hypothetical protein
LLNEEQQVSFDLEFIIRQSTRYLQGLLLGSCTAAQGVAMDDRFGLKPP